MPNPLYYKLAKKCESVADQIEDLMKTLELYSEELEGYVGPDEMQGLADAYDLTMELSEIIF